MASSAALGPSGIGGLMVQGGAIAEVLVERGAPRPLDYAIPAHLAPSVTPGSFVEVFLRGQRSRGVVVRVKGDSRCTRLESVLSVQGGELGGLPPDLVQLSAWIAEYYATPQSRVLRQMLPAAIRADAGHQEQLFVRRKRSLEETMKQAATLRRRAPAQAAVLDALLRTPKGLLLTELVAESGTSRSPVDTLARDGWVTLEKVVVDRSPLEAVQYLPSQPKTLHPEQAEALRAILETLHAGVFRVHLVQGVTGSGKTEVYLQAIEAALRMQRGVILMVPEIALTAQLVERFRCRFPDKVAVLHHRLSDGERYDQWHALRTGQLAVAIGARSVVYAPVQRLGLIVVDEEHESSYKAGEEMPAIQARDVAVVRARMCEAAVILGSATPSLESRYNADMGKYQLHRLTQRASSHALPQVRIVDMKLERERGQGFFSQALIDAIRLRVERSEQVLLFLNRRGYFTVQKCQACGEAVCCPHCSVSLTFHRSAQHLRCHLCGFMQEPPPCRCPHCGDAHSLRFGGVGTEQVEGQVRKLLPGIRTLRIDADTTKHKGSHEELLRAFGQGRAQVLIGTQMIAKGLHFPRITLVGVLHADAGLHVPEFRAAETTFQLITQVAGRAGRGELPGEVIVQTSLPEHPLLLCAASQDYEAFYKMELDLRKMVGYPPYGRLVRLILSGKDQVKVERGALAIAEECARWGVAEVEIYPATECGLSRVKEQYRWHVVCRQPRPGLLQPFFSGLAVPGGCHLHIDVDPAHTFS